MKRFFPFPLQSETNTVLSEAKRLVVSGENVQVSKALLSLRRCPLKHEGKRKKGWYERGINGRKCRLYTCSIGRIEDHTVTHSSLHQLIGPSQWCAFSST